MSQAEVTSPSPSSQQPATLARELIDMLNARALDAIEERWHDDLYEDFIVLRAFRGKRAVRGFFEGLFAAFPDFHLEVETCIGDDTTAFIAWRATATFTGGPFEGIQANGASLDIRGVDRMEFEDGKLVRNTVYYDGMGFAREIGMFPAADSGAEKAMKTAFNAMTAAKKRLLG